MCVIFKMCIWGDNATRPLLSISPHGGKAVAGVVLMSAPRRPDHHVLLTTVEHFPSVL